MRPEKNLIVTEIAGRVNDVPYVMLTDYTGMKVPEFNELRNRLRGAQAEFKVVKNTLLKRALTEAKLPEFDGLLTGQTAVVIGKNDVSAAAKVLKTFNAEFKRPGIKAAILDNAFLDQSQVLALAGLPSREVLLGKILGLLNAPASQLVRIINTPAAQLAQVIKANSEKAAA